MRIVENPHRGQGLSHPVLESVPYPDTDAASVVALLTRCPRSSETNLIDAPALAQAAGVARFWVKDERSRMGLGSFKALGAAHVIARDHEAGSARGRTYITASAGNHGLSVAAGAAAFGAQAIVFLAATVPESFAERLRDEGATVRRAGDTYEDSMQAALDAANAGEGHLLSDSSWEGYTTPPHILMQGYTALMSEVFAQIPDRPSHILLQAGVGGLAGAAAAMARSHWGDAPRIIVVEPEAAPALIQSIEAAAPVDSTGPVSIMGRLDCKTSSLIALKGLARDADAFVTISETEAADGTEQAARFGLASSPSGAAGIVACLTEHSATQLGLKADSTILTILSEMADT